MSYHLTHIERGVLGELSKIKEELDEAIDADNQNVKLMVLVELSDLTGALIAYLNKHHPGISIEDLIAMSKVTKRAFESGRRE